MQVDTTECSCCQDQDVIRSRECYCEPIKINIPAMVMHDLYGLETKIFDWPADFACSWKEVLEIIQFYLLQNFALPLNISENLNFLEVHQSRNF